MLSKEERGKVDKAIKRVLCAGVEKRLWPLLWHQISAGGKRLRPALAIVSCRMLGGRLTDALYPAAGLEILHNYTLIVDDIMDHSEVRRNKPSTWSKYGRSMAECLAMDYSAAVFQAAARCRASDKIREIFASTLKKVIDGQVEDLLFERAGRRNEPYIIKHRPQRVGESHYQKMIAKKTASLFEAACWTGAVCAKAKPNQIKALRDYGFNLGMAFQARDDILDIFGEQKKFGKKIGQDIKEHKGANIVLLYAQSRLTALSAPTPEVGAVPRPRESGQLERILSKEKVNRKDIKTAMHLIKKTKAKQKAQALVEKFASQAKKPLARLPQNKYNQQLSQLADFIILRDH